VIFETKRLLLRKLKIEDKESLAKIFTDKDSMKYYPNTFSESEVEKWITWNINNYEKYNYGLWAVVLKDENIVIGDCGITLQEINNELLPELGYHIDKEYCNKGFASEAAEACKNYAFEKLDIPAIYSYMTPM
jgi:RimJ/RimL family protein N-acetyltransferase